MSGQSSVLVDLLGELERRSITLSVDEGKLRYESPPDALDGDLRARLTQHKPALIRLFESEEFDATLPIVDLDFEKGAAPFEPFTPPSAPDQDDAPVDDGLSYAQQRLWFLDQLGMPPSVYALPVAFRLHGAVRVDLLDQALCTIVARHEALRTVVRTDADGEGYQHVLESPSQLLEQATSESDGHDEACELIARPFDLSRDLMLRARLIQCADNDAVFVLVMHHIASDGWSVAILLHELNLLYAQALGEPTTALSAVPLQYRAFATQQRAWLEGGALARQLEFWRERLDGEERPETTLPLLAPRPARQSYRGRRLERHVSHDLTATLEDYARTKQASLFMVTLAAFYLVLHRTTGLQDLSLGTPIANRTRLDTESMIGFFTNTLVLRTLLDPAATFAELLTQVRGTALDAFEHQDVPFERLVQELQPERNLASNPLFQMLFVMQNTPTTALALPMIDAEPIRDLAAPVSKFDLTLELVVRDAGLQLHAVYAEELFAPAQIESLLESFEAVLARIVVTEDEPVATLPLLTANARQRRIERARGPIVSPEGPQDLFSLFARQYERTPDAIALVSDAGNHTYADVEAMATAVHRQLDTAGVSRGDVVGVALEPGADVIAAILGIVRAAAVWLPLDPTYPRARLDAMLADAGARIIVTRSELDIGGASASGHRCLIDKMSTAHDRFEPALSPVSVQPDDPAYLIYTSGSTGTPKGVLGTHGGLANRFTWMWRAYPFAAHERCCVKTAMSFVDSIWEMFGPLCAGIPSVVLTTEERQDVRQLVTVLASHAVTRISLVPSQLAVIIDAATRTGCTLPALEYCFSSGETLPVDLARRFSRCFPHVTLVNLYGSSEVSADVTHYRVDPARPCTTHLPIGRPIDNTSVQVIAPDGEPAGIGVRGEIVIAGRNVAAGYYRRDTETTARFARQPDDVSRWFLSGDHGRWNAHGELELLGREDQQVKIRGHRVDCLEVLESVLRQSGVVAAHVDVTPTNSGDALRAIVQLDSECPPTLGALREHLARQLPPYLVPSVFYPIESLPLLPNGKVDVALLSTMDVSAETCLPDASALSASSASAHSSTGSGSREPETPLEHEIHAVWQDLLERPILDIDADFFESGGHSLLAIRLVHRLEDCIGRPVPLALVFEQNTIRRMAAALSPAPAADTVTPNRSLLPIRAGDGTPGVFLVPPLGMTGLYFSSLAACLPDSLALHSFDSAASLEQTSAEQLAAHYLAEMRQIQLSGPWHIVAACFGTHIAFEMAQQLVAAGDTDVTLYVIDSNPPLNGPGWQSDERERQLTMKQRSRWRFYGSLIRQGWRQGDLTRLFDKQLKKLRGLFDPTTEHYLKVKAHELSLLRQYEASPTNARLVLLMSREFVNEQQLDRWRHLGREHVDVWHLPVDTHTELARRHSVHWRLIAERVLADLPQHAPDGADS